VDILLSDISSFYVEESRKHLFSILGSLNIIGNPSQIIRDFSGGMSALTDDRGQNSVQKIAGGAGVIAKSAIGG
jgi:hypothetical protein